MIAADSSVVVAAFASWHEFHEMASRALDGEVRLPAHAALESYSVLTRLPSPHRAQPELVRSFLADRFSAPLLLLDSGAHKLLVDEFVSLGIAGGAVYDGLICATAREAGATLVTCDRRAATTYDRLRASFRLLG
ncbi:MAG: type II toxin-antitoxin system VapC family toxin [Gaiellaceae bacterium MAG52_C11]|nr:type II toxin-antitoxin system VapC family toxin [Candidatus Gaiellasilicea maunaloa]